MIRATLRRLAWPAALVSLVLLFLLPILLGRSFWLRDMLVFHYPLKAYLRARLAVGELAAWNPHLGLGRPFLGVVQPAVLYPLDVLLLAPYPRGVDLFFAIHAPIAALGMRAWLRAHDADELAALFGGALLALSGYYVSQLEGNGSYAVSVAWVPWAAWALARFAGSLRAVPLVAIFVALMLLGGDPQAAAFTVALLACEALACARGQRLRTLVLAGAGVLLGAALAAAQLAPALEVAAVGRPGGVPLADARHFSFPLQRLIELLWPGAFGPPYAPDWPLHRLYDEGTGAAYEPWSAGVYLGLGAPLWILVAVAQRRRRAIALFALLVASLLVAFGWHTPIFALFFEHVPGARQFRYPEKYLFVTTLTACALIPAGLDAAVAFLRARVRPLQAVSPLWLRGALVIIVLVDLIAASLPLADYVPAAFYRETPPPIAAMRATGAAGLVRVYRPQYADYSLPGISRAAIARGTLRPDCGIDEGIAQLDAYDNFPLPHEQLLWRALAMQPLRLVEVLGARFVLLSASRFKPQPGLESRQLWPELGLVLAEVTHPAPRVYLATDTRVLDDDAAATALAAPDFLPGAGAILAPGAVAVAGHAEGRCTLEDDRVERLRLRCDSDAPSYAIVGDAFFPGWHATVDGSAAPILRANLAMRAIPVPAGTHRVELTYRPGHFTSGCVVSGCALALAIALLVLSRRRR